MKDRLQRERKEYRLWALAQSALRDRRYSPGESLDSGFDLIKVAWSLHDAAKKSLTRRGR
ncbi:MAG TPA: hypothetical protein VGR51_10675 [Thermoplasmata archaeon]|jgi:hypothetical protein|nr:hypothetical protein [Thermoplasmata archaeon]